MSKKPKEQIYGGRRPPDYRLAHNQVMHTPEFMHGTNGFRRFWIPPQWVGKGWRKCPCGWRPDAGDHYAINEVVTWWTKEIEKRGSVEAVHLTIGAGRSVVTGS